MAKWQYTVETLKKMAVPSLSTFNNAPELGVLFVFSSIMCFYFMRAIKGKPGRISSFICSRDWPFLNNPASFRRNLLFATFGIGFTLTWPIWSLLAWGILAAYVHSLTAYPIVGVGILLVGFAALFFVFAVLYTKWSNWRLTTASAVLFVLCEVFFVSFQICAVFMTPPYSFFGMSSVFFSLNAMIMVLIIFMNHSQGVADPHDVLRKTKQLDPSTVTDVYTLELLGQRNARQPTAVSGGLQNVFGGYSPARRMFISALLYLVAVGILAVYAILIFFFTPEKPLGFITLVAAVTTDVTLYLMVHSGMVSSPASLSALMLACRGFLIGFGGNWWFLGYCGLYIFFGINLTGEMMKQRLPYFNVKAGSDDDEDHKVDMAKAPEFILLFITIVFAVFIVVLGVGRPGLPSLVIAIGTKPVEMWIFGLASLDVNLLILLGWMTYRLHQRKKRGILGVVQYYVYFANLDVYWIALLVTVAVVVLTGVVAFYLVGSWLLLDLCLFIPVIWMIGWSTYLQWVKNDYDLIQDIKKLNASRRAKATIQGLKGAAASASSVGTNDAGATSVAVVTVQDLTASVPAAGQRAAISMDGNGNVQSSSVLPTAVEAAIPDWRDEGFNVVSAFFHRKLTSTDYKTIGGFFLTVILIICMGITLFFTVDPWIGSAIAAALFVVIFSILPIIEYFATLKASYSVWLSLSISVGVLIAYGTTAFHFILMKDATAPGTIPTLFCCVGYPGLLVFVTGILKWREDKWKVSPLVITCLVLAFLFDAAFIIGLCFLVSIGAGIAIAVLTVVGVAGAVIVAYWAKQNYYLSVTAQMVILVVLVLSAVALLLVGIFTNALALFWVITAFFALLIAVLVLSAFWEFKNDSKNSATAPVFYSPFVFPVFQYQPNKEAVKPHNFGAACAFSAIVMALVWSLLVTMLVPPPFVGVGASAIIHVFVAVIAVYVAGTNPVQLGQAMRFVNGEGVKKAWEDAKKSFLGTQVTADESSRRTVLQLFDEYHSVKQRLQVLLNGGGPITVQVQDSAASKPDREAWTGETKDIRQIYQRLLALDDQIDKAFHDEMILIVHFQLLLTVSADAAQRREESLLKQFVAAKSIQLQEAKITFPHSGGRYRYLNTVRRIESLKPAKRKVFDELWAQFLKDVAQQEAKAKEREKLEDEAERKRREELERLQREREEKKKKQEEIGTAANIEDMVDSEEKFRLIVERFKKTQQLYEDDDFPANEKALGNDRLVKQCPKWSRPAAGAKIFVDAASPMDITQGALGDCYFLSAMSVLALKQEMLNNIILHQEEQSCGAYCVRFFKDNEWHLVIVDSRFPCLQNDKFAFVTSLDGLELWPMILEKAYAKFYGSYGAIEAGKVHFALADLTAGVSEEIKLAAVKSNPAALWEKILKFGQQSFLMGAGSPESAMGDRDVSEMGIVQGHAYAILDVQEVSNNRLLKIRNPHGSRGVEWQGDWSDGSEMWTKKIKQKIAHQDQEDGEFWMCLDDFLEEFSSLYICRRFDAAVWGKSPPPVTGCWKGETAVGLPSAQNKTPELQKNPQYVITVTEATSVFLSLAQKSTVDMFKGKLPIAIFLLAKGGKRAKAITRADVVGSSGPPTNLKEVTCEAQLEAKSYPQSFTIMVASALGGAAGEGEYTLTVRSTRAVDFKLIPDSVVE